MRNGSRLLVLAAIAAVVALLAVTAIAVHWHASELASRQRLLVRDAVDRMQRDALRRATRPEGPGQTDRPSTEVTAAAAVAGADLGAVVDPQATTSSLEGFVGGLGALEPRLAEIEHQVRSSLRTTLFGLIMTCLVFLLVVGGVVLGQSRRSARQVSDRIRQLAREALTSQESERMRVSRELHDGVCQVLVSTRWMLEHSLLTEAAPPPSGPAAPAIGKALERLDLALQEVRHISHDLRPPVLDELGLVAAVEALVEDVNAESRVRARFTSNAGLVDFEPAIAAMLFRIGQEAVSNALRHSACTRLDVALMVSRRKLALTVIDNGQGFDPARLPAGSGQGMGLRNISSRTEALGGTVALRSGDGRGTRLRVEVPLEVAIQRFGKRQPPGSNRSGRRPAPTAVQSGAEPGLGTRAPVLPLL